MATINTRPSLRMRLLVIVVLTILINLLIILQPGKASPVKINQGNQRDRYGGQWSPVVMWHGMGDTAFGSIRVVQKSLETRYPGMHVHSIQIGTNAIEDETASYFVNANTQLDIACEQVLSNEYVQQHKAFNAIGFSQGGQFIRALIQRCPFAQHNITVKNFISLGGQHQGVCGLPHCSSDNYMCHYARYLIEFGVYSRMAQEHVVQAEYWHDPLLQDEYVSKSVFLADINNERQINETYRTNIKNLEHMVLVMFTEDEIMVPRESAHFGFYKLGQTKEIEPMESTDIYLQDRIGLKTLNESNRLTLMSIPGGHLQFKMKWFMDAIAANYLAN